MCDDANFGNLHFLAIHARTIQGRITHLNTNAEKITLICDRSDSGGGLDICDVAFGKDDIVTVERVALSRRLHNMQYTSKHGITILDTAEPETKRNKIH